MAGWSLSGSALRQDNSGIFMQIQNPELFPRQLLCQISGCTNAGDGHCLVAQNILVGIAGSAAMAFFSLDLVILVGAYTSLL